VKLETKHMTKSFTVITISLQQRQKQGSLIDSTLERLQYHIKHSIWIQIETAYTKKPIISQQICIHNDSSSIQSGSTHWIPCTWNQQSLPWLHNIRQLAYSTK